MSMFAKRKDSNTDDIMIAILEAGWSYLDTHDYGYGFPDCIAYKFFGNLPVSVLIEIKTKTGKLTKAEEQFHYRYDGLVHICRDEESVALLLAEYDKKFNGRYR